MWSHKALQLISVPAWLLQNPIRAYDEKKIGWFFNKTGSLSIDLNLAKTGYVPGEKIHLNCTIANSSKQDMAGTKVKLYQVQKNASD